MSFSALLRWYAFGAGAFIAVVILQYALTPHRIRGQDSEPGKVAIAAIGLLMAITALAQIPAARYAASAFCVFNLVDFGRTMTRAVRSGGAGALLTSVNLAFLIINAACLALLFTPHGEQAFGSWL